ncbi:N-acetyltransferase [Natronospirillum operosum]|uniref:N-acetyltransferase n=1 Tax=Natronospirillum operosum TaxID=2759953 RepID=A0A4Z0W7X8_9GAMM|nr:GNAT family N-acetyltransferase [Natronospirillum operosum]TGG92847.1 N-acetyltransferase [Natronospirillum operosum]
MMIRDYRPSDFEEIMAIYAQSKLDELRFEPKKFELLPLEKDEKRLQSLLASRIFVWEADGITGYGAVCQNDIESLFVHPRHRGQGIGSTMFEYLLTEVDSPARLYVAKSNAPAIALYRKYGFSVSREFETSYNGRAVMANEMVRMSEAPDSQ